MANPTPSHGAGQTSTKLDAGALIRKAMISDLAQVIEMITEEGEEMDRLLAENEQLRNELSKRPAPAAASTEQPEFFSSRVSSAYSRITIPSNNPALACKAPSPAHSSSHPFNYCPAFQAPMRKDCFFDGTPTTYFDFIEKAEFCLEIWPAGKHAACMVTWVAQHLSGPPLDWYHCLVREKHPALRSWSAFKAHFEKKYRTYDEILALERKWNEVKMGDTSVEVHNLQFFYFARALRFPLDGPAMRSKYEHSLRDDIGKMVRLERLRDKGKWERMTAEDVAAMALELGEWVAYSGLAEVDEDDELDGPFVELGEDLVMPPSPFHLFMSRPPRPTPTAQSRAAPAPSARAAQSQTIRVTHASVIQPQPSPTTAPNDPDPRPLNARGPLTKVEREWRERNGRCTYCNQQDHGVESCAKKAGRIGRKGRRGGR